MNKRIICLLLSLVMLLACLAGCGKKDDEEVKDDITDEASESAVTLSMYLMTDVAISSEQAVKIENAVNRITKSKFKTQMKITFLTENEYYATLEANLQKQVENAGIYDDSDYEDEETEAETVWNEELGTVELKYPTITDYQVDIFYFSGKDRFDNYIENDYLSILDEEIASASKALKSYITPAYLTYMKALEDGTYAIPTNKPIGEYTYMLLNKEALNLTKFSPKQFSSLTDKDCQEMLEMLTNGDPEWDGRFVPVYSTTGELDITGVQFWGVDENGELSDNFSVLGGNIDKTKPYGTLGAYSDVANVLSSTTFVEQLKVLKGYEANGYYNDAEVKNGKPFAVGYMKGTADSIAQYAEDYEIVVVDVPTLKADDLYDDMFGVSSYTANLSRSMEIVTYLNTNEDFRNLILYGIEGENYELLQSDLKDVNGEVYPLVKRLNENYMMSASKTGNTLLAYPLEHEMANRIEYYTAQNRDAKAAQNIAFKLNYENILTDMDKLQAIRALSEKIYTELMNCSYENFDALVADKIKEIDENEAVAFHIDPLKGNTKIVFTGEGEEFEIEVDPTAVCSFHFIYFKWLEDNRIYQPPTEEGGGDA